MHDPFQVVRDFEAALCEYTGARFAVTTTSCTMALLLACAYHSKDWRPWEGPNSVTRYGYIQIPKRTYVGVPMSIIHAGWRPTFIDQDWHGFYHLKPLPISDCARRFTYGMCHNLELAPMACVSFHPSKILGLSTHGGAILHDSQEADAWLRRARFDGRTEGVSPKEDSVILGWHCYMNPVTAAEGLEKLSRLPAHNEDLPNSDYPDLSTMEIFK